MQIQREAIGETIRELRKKKGMTQEVLSGFAGIARSHLAMIENNTKAANLETICRIAAALEMRPSELVRIFEETSLKTASNHDKHG